MTATIQTPSPVSRRVFRRAIAFGGAAVISLGAIGVGVGFAATRPSAPMAPGTARLAPGDAAVTVRRGSPTAAADAPLRSGDALTVVGGVAIVQTSAGRMLARPGTTINFGDTSPRIARGDVLIVGKKFAVDTDSASLVADGVTRVRQALSLEVIAYDGRASVNTARDTFAVDQLHRVVIAGSRGAASGRVSPVALDDRDAWDRQYLGVAIELDRGLVARSRGLDLQTAGVSAAERNRVLAALQPWDDLVALGDASVGDAVVAAELVRAARLDADGVRTVLQWRAAGAPWGLIAFQLGLTQMPGELPGVDEAAIAQAPAVPVTVPQASTAVTVPSAAAELPNVRVPVGGGVKTPPATPTTAAPAANGDPGAGTVVVVDPLGGLVNAVGNVLGGLLGS